MRALVLKLLRRLAGERLTGEIVGDMAESGAGLARLSGIALSVAAIRARDGIEAVGRWLSPAGVSNELRYAARSLVRAPWFALTVVSVIALSMALATAVFAVVDGVLFKPLPYPQAGRLYAVQPETARRGRPSAPMSASAVDLANWSVTARDAGVTGFTVGNEFVPGDMSHGTVYAVANVQSNFFDVIGVRPLVGGFADDDFGIDIEHAPKLRPAILSYDVWQARFAGDPTVVGRTMVTDLVRETGFRIVGVMPAGFLFPSQVADTVQLITPRLQRFAGDPRARSIREVIARMPEGVGPATLGARIEAGMAVTAASLPAPSSRGPAYEPYDRASIVPLGRVMGARERPVFTAIFLAAVILVSLGAVNVSGLLAARCLDRARELSLRRALGAAAASLARLVIAEAVMLIVAGCAIGWAAAPSLLHVGLALLPDRLSLLKTPVIDVRVAGFVTLSALILAVPTTIWPIRRALGLPAGALADGNSATERRRSAGRFVVVMSQVAGAAVLTIFGALLVWSTLALYAVSSNVRTDDVVSAPAWIEGGVSSPAEQTARMEAILDRLRAMPGVSMAAAMSRQTLRGGGATGWFNAPPDAANPAADVTVLGGTPEIFRVLGLRLVRGRLPTPEEFRRDAPVLVVSESIASAYWPRGSAVGQTLTLGDGAKPFLVAGVVKDVRWQGMDQDIGNIYGPYALLPHSFVGTFYLRVPRDAGAVTASVDRVIQQADPLVQTLGAATLAERFSSSIKARRLQAWLFGAFATSALVIVGVGIFGLMAMAMARRGREVGIRMALGASRPQTVSLLMREQLTAVMAGLVIGGGVAAWAVRFMSWFLYNLGAYDLRVWSLAIATIVLTAAIGTLVPSLKASRVNPVDALRVE